MFDIDAIINILEEKDMTKIEELTNGIKNATKYDLMRLNRSIKDKIILKIKGEKKK